MSDQRWGWVSGLYPMSTRQSGATSPANDWSVFQFSRSSPTTLYSPMLYFNSQWTDVELDESILKLCDEFPDARMAAFSRALEHCRHTTPRAGPDSLLNAMRDSLRMDRESQRYFHPASA